MKSKILMVGNILLGAFLIMMIITNYKNYSNLNRYIDKYSSKKVELAESKDKIEELNNTLAAVSNVNSKTSNIEKISTDFVTAFYNYDALTKYKIYKNIKPYSTESLIQKLKPVKENDLESDVNYHVSIENIRVYKQIEISNLTDINVLVLANIRMKTKSSNSISPVLLELNLTAVKGKLLVNDFEVNQNYEDTNS